MNNLLFELAAWICLVLGLIGQTLFGMFLGARILCFGRSVEMSPAERWGLGLVLGIGATAWTLFMLSFCGAPLGFPLSAAITVLGFVAGGPQALLMLRRRPMKVVKSAEFLASNAVCQALQAAIGILFVLCLLQTLQTPQKLWDERAAFAIKARVLFEEHSINSPVLRHPDFVQYHPRYPLLLPLAEEHIYSLLGRSEDRWSKLVFPLLYLGMVLTAAGVLTRHVSASLAWLVATMMATAPALMPYEYGFLCGQADAPVACFHAVSILYLWDGLKRLRQGEFAIGSFIIAGMGAGFTAFTKDEGIAYSLIDSAILALCVLLSVIDWNRFRKLLVGALVYAATIGLLLVPWFVHRRQLPLTTEMNYFGRMTLALFVERLVTLQWSLPHLVERMFKEWREWGLQWWLMLFSLLQRPLRALQPAQLLLLLDVVGSLASLLVAGMLAPAQLEEHIGGSSHRFLMQIAPVAVLFAAAMFVDDDRSSQQDATNS